MIIIWLLISVGCYAVGEYLSKKFAISHPWEQGSPYPFRVGEELRPIENNLMFCETSPYVLLLW